MLQPDDVAFMEAEVIPVLSDVIPHRHHVLRVLRNCTRLALLIRLRQRGEGLSKSAFDI